MHADPGCARDGMPPKSRSAEFILRMILTQPGGEAVAHGVFGHRARLDEVQEILGPARLGARARKPEAPERLAPDQAPGDAAVQVEVAPPELAAGQLQV